MTYDDWKTTEPFNVDDHTHEHECPICTQTWTCKDESCEKREQFCNACGGW